jgi:hypothetical protein
MDRRMMYPQVNAVIEILKNVPDSDFNMNEPLNCIGGHCVRTISPNRYIGVLAGFMQVSGIGDEIIADMVCFPRKNLAYFAKVAQAINMLEYLRDYGIVDWDRAMGVTHA